MNRFESFLVELLQEKIVYNDKIVYVQKHFSNDADLPVITLDTSRGVTTEYYYKDIDVKDTLYSYRQSNIDINIWCNTDEERNNITNQILNCFYKEKNNHYTYCTKYNNGTCDCHVHEVENGSTAKEKCPDINYYGYQSLTLKHGLIEGSILIEPPYDLDELNEHPPILRSILSANAEYYEKVTPDSGEIIDDITIGEIQL